MNQNGFRPKRSTLAKILALRRLIEGIKSEEFAGYSDIRRLSKVFDSIHRGWWTSWRHMAYRIKSWKLLKYWYWYGGASTISWWRYCFFPNPCGCLPRRYFGTTAFILALDYIMRKATLNTQETGFTLTPRRSRRHLPIIITDSDFADDIVLLSDTVRKSTTTTFLHK